MKRAMALTCRSLPCRRVPRRCLPILLASFSLTTAALLVLRPLSVILEDAPLLTGSTATLLPLAPCLQELVRSNNHSEARVRVVSFGGVGTSKLLVHLQKHGVATNSPQDRDGLKHSLAHKGERVLYIVGDPGHSIESLFRRNYACKQAKKLGKRDPVVAATCTSLDLYKGAVEAAGIDFFGIERHFDTWRCRPNVLVVTIDCMVRNAGAIAAFMGADVRVFDGFQARSGSSVQANRSSRFDRVYGAIWDRMRRAACTCDDKPGGAKAGCRTV